MKRIKKINNIGENHKLLAISFFPILAIFISLVFGHKVLLEEYLKILKHPGLLITDYTYVGGFYGTLFNISLVALLNLIIIYYFKIPLNGLVFAGFFTGIGFSAFGKTILNILPIYLGGYIYAKKGFDTLRARLDAGADLVQGYTAFLYRGPLWARGINRGLAAAPRPGARRR